MADAQALQTMAGLGGGAQTGAIDWSKIAGVTDPSIFKDTTFVSGFDPTTPNTGGNWLRWMPSQKGLTGWDSAPDPMAGEWERGVGGGKTQTYDKSGNPVGTPWDDSGAMRTALIGAGLMGGAAFMGLGAAGGAGATQLTPALIESMMGTTGYGASSVGLGELGAAGLGVAEAAPYVKSSADLAALYGPEGYGAGLTAAEAAAAGLGVSTAGMTAAELAKLSASYGPAIAEGVSAGTGAGAGTAAATPVLDQLKNFGGGSLLKDLFGIGSGVYGMTQAADTKELGREAIEKSSPWATSGGMDMAGDALKRAISGDFANDPGYKLAELSAARTSAQQPGGFAASAAALAATKYQNERIAALSGPAGVGFSPATGYQTALDTERTAQDQSSKSLASLGFALDPKNSAILPWLENWFTQQLGGP